MKLTSIHAFLVLVFSCALTAGAATVDSGTATAAVKGWLRAEPSPLGARLGNEVTNVETFKDVAGRPLYHVVYLKPSGFVVVSADDQAGPIIAFATRGRFDPSEKNPLGALVSRDLPKRLDHLRRNPNTAAAARSHDKWQKLQQLYTGSTNGVQANGLTSGSISDVRVAPLLTCLWNQATADGLPTGPACYNFFTPPHAEGASSNAVCGCVATAMAQLMYSYQYPTAAVGTNTFEVSFDTDLMTRQLRGGDGNGGPYDWADMPADPSNATLTQCEAIGALTSDAGVAVKMQYTDLAAGSAAYLSDAETAFVTTFQFGNAVLTESSSINAGYDLYNMVNADLDARVPVIFGIENTGGEGHAIVCDGYGYSAYGTLYHHLNMGWGGDDNAWYQLPIIDISDSDPFYNFDACLYNVFTNGSGEIISGRVLDPKGNPLPGSSVTGISTKGGIFKTTTDGAGIYALVGVPSDSTCMISVASSGYFPETSNFVAGVSFDNGTSCGNRWESDFIMVPAQGAPVFTVQPGNQSVTVGSNATFYAYATGQLPMSYQWQYKPQGSLNWANVNDDATDSGSRTPTLTVGPAALAMNGEPLQCVATNSLGSVTSAPVMLSVSSLPYLSLGTLAGVPGIAGCADGPAGGAMFNAPHGIAVDSQTNIFVADFKNHVIREVSPAAGGWTVSTIAGQAGIYGSANGVGTNAQFNAPYDVAVDNSGHVYVADTGNDTIRLLTPSGPNWVVSTIAGTAGFRGTNDGFSALFSLPMGIAVAGNGSVYVTDEGNHDIRQLLSVGTNWLASTIAGSGKQGFNDGTNTMAQFGEPCGIAVDNNGNIYVTDSYNDNIRKLTPAGASWVVTTLCGLSGAAGSADGFGSAARFQNPSGIAADAYGNLYVTDTGNNTIRRLTLLGTNWLAFTSAGTAGATGTADGTGPQIQFNAPFGIAINNGTNLYVSDSKNDSIRSSVVASMPAMGVVHLVQQVTQSAFAVTWSASVGHTYQVQYKTNLSQGAWSNFATVTASNWTGVASVPVGSDPGRFYRVVPLQ